ncbi:MAG: Crp/Fnr family transcriptional regulator [Dissulfurispiraceae bacterium]
MAMVNVHDLKKQVLFRDIDERDLQKLAAKLEVRSYKVGDYLYKEGEERKGLYLIHSGRVEVTNIVAGGIEYPLFVSGPGSFSGVMVLFGETQHETNGKALGDTTVYLFPKEEIESIENHDVILAYQIFKNLAHLFSVNSLKMFRKIRDLMLVSAKSGENI